MSAEGPAPARDARRLQARYIACAAVAALVITAPRAANADLYLAGGFGMTWLRRVPSVSIESLDLQSRTVPESDARNRGGMVMLGGYCDLGLVAGDKWMAPLFGVGLHLPVGSFDEVVTSADGSIATLRPWSAWTLDGLFPGFGIRAKHRRWMAAATLRTGLSVFNEGGSVIGGVSAKPFEGIAASFLLVAELEACRRLDPEQRVCISLGPRVYGFGWMNGATVGLRYELGR